MDYRPDCSKWALEKPPPTPKLMSISHSSWLRPSLWYLAFSVRFTLAAQYDAAGLKPKLWVCVPVCFVFSVVGAGVCWSVPAASALTVTLADCFVFCLFREGKHDSEAEQVSKNLAACGFLPQRLFKMGIPWGGWGCRGALPF